MIEENKKNEEIRALYLNIWLETGQRIDRRYGYHYRFGQEEHGPRVSVSYAHK